MSHFVTFIYMWCILSICDKLAWDLDKVPRDYVNYSWEEIAEF